MDTLKVTLSPRILEAKQAFMKKYKPKQPYNTLTDSKYQQTFQATLIQKYLEEVYQIKTSTEFLKELITAHFKYHEYCNFNMPFNVVDAIFISCEMWKDYLASEEDFNNLICGEIISYVEIHCSVIRTRDFHKKTNINLKSLPHKDFGTIVSYNGYQIKILP